MNFIDIRQSNAWSDYLKIYGWTSHQLPNGGITRTARLAFVSVARIHRAKVLNADDLKKAAELYSKHGVIYSRISPSINQDLKILEGFGYKQTSNIDLPPRTSFINLESDESSLWKNLTKDCRYSVNKSNDQKDYVEIIQNPSVEQVGKYYKVIHDRSHRTKFYTPPLKDHLQKVKSFGKESFIGFVYNKENELLGTKMFLGYNEAVWYMYSGITKHGEKSSGNYKLMWESIKFFKERGYSILDMEGLSDNRLRKQTKKWNNYSDYKLQFGGDIVKYPLPYNKFSLS